MADKNSFVHLTLARTLEGRPKLPSGGKGDEKTAQNKSNRAIHGGYIKRRSGELSRFWQERRDIRVESGLPPIEFGIPFLLEIDPGADVEWLRGLGFEVVCSLDDGFIIVASEDVDLATLNDKTDEFIDNVKKRCNSPARIYAMCNDSDRLQRLLSDELHRKWNTLGDDDTYTIDLGVSCNGAVVLPDQPARKEGETSDEFESRWQTWKGKCDRVLQQWDEIMSARQQMLIDFISPYFVGEISSFIEEADSFSVRIKIRGKGLRDLVLNFPYLFEVAEAADIQMESAQPYTLTGQDDVSIIAPDEDDPIVCVIDSGIQEAHKYLAEAIVARDSKCFLPLQTDVSDEVSGGGHGTIVAGAILYPNEIPREGSYQLPCFIRNIRVLDSTNSMPEDIVPEGMVLSAIELFSKQTNIRSKIYNQSIGERHPFKLKHMSAWAAQIDLLSYENDILVVQAAGNISEAVISSYISAGHPYPDYLGRELSRLSNPAQSLQALTVGSLSMSDYETEDAESMGTNGDSSSFSRVGPGIWDTIKPDVVEYGGTHVISKSGTSVILTTPPEVCPELIRRSPEGPAYSRDAIGTSFSTPKVTHIASAIEKILPNAPALLYRALIAQSARWTNYSDDFELGEKQNMLRRVGNGLPDVNRATHNDEYRVTFVTPTIAEIGEHEAHVYNINIPQELSAVGEDYDVLIEVTLSYAAKPRRTRRYIRSYLSTWVDWVSSRIGESSDSFAKRIFETNSRVDDEGNFSWTIGERTDRGEIDDFSRTKGGTLQKDWCIVKSHQLTDAFCIAIRGHKGWGSLFKAKYALTVSFEAIGQAVPIYEPISLVNMVETEAPEIEVELDQPLVE